jgi:hypothetical protein
MGLQNYIFDLFKAKQWTWYQQVQRMGKQQMVQTNARVGATVRRNTGRPSVRWTMEIHDELVE